MAEHDDDLHRRQIVGQLMREHWEADPPDPTDWARALEGCAQLYSHAANHLRADPPRYAEAVRCIAIALDTGYEIRGQATIAYAMSGQAVDDFMRRVSDALGNHDDGQEADRG